MKKLLLVSIIISHSCLALTQVLDSTSAAVNSGYIQKSKNQKGGALVLLGGGSALILSGQLIGNNQKSTFGDAAAGAVLAGVGVLSALSSIPLFIASGRNKKKAISSTAWIKMETKEISHKSLTTHYPALAFKINF